MLRGTGYALVDVATDRQIGCVAANQLWVAAVPLNDVLDAVLAKVPSGWAASKLLNPEQSDVLADARGVCAEVVEYIVPLALAQGREIALLGVSKPVWARVTQR